MTRWRLAARRDRRGYAMILALLFMVTVAVTSSAVLTASFNEVRSSQLALESTQGRVFAATAAEEIFSRIASQGGFLDPLFDTDPATWPNHPAVGSVFSTLKWARLDRPGVTCNPTDYVSDCYHVDLRSLGSTPAAPVAIEVTARYGCGGSEPRCAYHRYELRVRRRQFFDFLYFHQFSTRDPQDYTTDGSVTPQYAQANCADRYALRPNGVLEPRAPQCSSIAFQGEGSSRDQIAGPVYTADDFITVCGNPNFTSPVLIGGAGIPAGASTRVWNAASGCSSSPSMTTTYPNAGVLGMPSAATTFTQASGAASLRLTAAGTSPVALRFSPVLSGLNYVTRVQVTGAMTNGTFTLPNPGIVTVDGNADVAGTIAGRLSVFASNDLVITGDLRYRAGGSSTNTTDVLGLTSGGALTITKSPSGRTIHALILSLKSSVRTQDWRKPDSPFNYSWVAPTLTFYGAMAAKYQGMFGGFDIATTRLVSGYRKSFTFDARPSTNPNLVPPLLISPTNSDWERLDVTELPGKPGALVTPGVTTTTAPPTTTTTPPAPTVPGAPTGVTAIGGSRSATVSWVLGSNGGSPISYHIVSVYRNGRFVKSMNATGATTTTWTVTGLSRRTYYTFAVAAVNSVGPGPMSAQSAPTRTR